MIAKDFFKMFPELVEQHEFSEQELLECLERGFTNAHNNVYGNKSCRVSINFEKNEINLYSVYRVVDDYSTELVDGVEEILIDDARQIKGKSQVKVGQIIEIPRSIKDLGRTGATAVKSELKQLISKINKTKTYNYFKELEGEMIKAKVIDNTKGKILLELPHDTKTLLPDKELLPNETLEVGDYISVFVKKVEALPKGTKVYVSRNDRNLIKRLLETYIPEIASGIIEVKGFAREAGDRAKVAVYSNDPQVDAIGSCVGEGGERIKQIVSALNGEKIDLYEWSNNIEDTIANSLQPATVTKVLNVDPKTKTSVVIVPTEQLSLAIGKNGQNVRLAVQSSGWKIDIKSYETAKEENLI